jgi:hypothetical protein
MLSSDRSGCIATKSLQGKTLFQETTALILFAVLFTGRNFQNTLITYPESKEGSPGGGASPGSLFHHESARDKIAFYCLDIKYPKPNDQQLPLLS